MAKKNLFVHLDMNKQELQNSKAQNVTSTEKTTLAATLVVADKGLFVYDITLNKLFAWNGTAFENVTPAPPQVGQYRGGVAHTDAVPANLVSGDWVIFTSAGTLTNFVAGQVVQIADLAFYNGTTWNLVQGNVVMATETVAGVVQLATENEVEDGIDTSKAITPSTLNVEILRRLNNLFYSFLNVNLVANVPTTLDYEFQRDVFDVNFFTGTAPNLTPVELAWSQNSANTVSITSNVDITVTAKVFVMNN